MPGAIAQLGERKSGRLEVRGSSPLSSIHGSETLGRGSAPYQFNSGRFHMDSNDVKEKAQETVQLSRWAYTLLILSATSGTISMLSHGIEFIHYLIGVL